MIRSSLLDVWEWKQDVTSAPLRRMLEVPSEEWNDEYVLTMGVVGAYTLMANVASPILLIDAGYKGLPKHTATIFGKYPWDTMYEYTTKASKAQRWGASLGGSIGAMAMQGLGHVTPFVGWFPVFEKGTMIGKMPVPSWMKKAGYKSGAKIGGKIGARLIPGLGWAMVAYDVYDITFNQSIWGFDLN